ncbi:MAG: hypothetical protein H6R04_940 [Burkholderiaceae bacterium]|nr:hypothetical protein [Burkholderiaceae bacterium]
MIARPHLKTLLAGCVLIVAANAAALIGVAYNRSGEADSTLRLSQRELPLPHAWRAAGENSGIALRLQWQMTMPESGETRHGSPSWLDKPKLAALGFDLPAQHGLAASKQRAKEVLLVLEFDGPARQQALERLRRRAAAEEALLAANPGKKEFEQRVKFAQNRMALEENGNSRLYLIDAGLDRNALRAQYPDRTRYAIVRGKIRPSVIKRKHEEILIGFVSSLTGNQINLPREFHPALGSLPPNAKKNSELKYQFELAFGQRLEPWIVAPLTTPMTAP